MKVVHKFTLPIAGGAFLLPLGPSDVIVHVAEQRGVPCVWVQRDDDMLRYASNLPPLPSGRTDRRRFRWVGTGDAAIHDSFVHRGTVLLQGGDLVLHLYEG